MLEKNKSNKFKNSNEDFRIPPFIFFSYKKNILIILISILVSSLSILNIKYPASHRFYFNNDSWLLIKNFDFSAKCRFIKEIIKSNKIRETYLYLLKNNILYSNNNDVYEDFKNSISLSCDKKQKKAVLRYRDKDPRKLKKITNLIALDLKKFVKDKLLRIETKKLNENKQALIALNEKREDLIKKFKEKKEFNLKYSDFVFSDPNDLEVEGKLIYEIFQNRSQIEYLKSAIISAEFMLKDFEKNNFIEYSPDDIKVNNSLGYYILLVLSNGFLVGILICTYKYNKSYLFHN